jgi:hypothetical protein
MIWHGMVCHCVACQVVLSEGLVESINIVRSLRLDALVFGDILMGRRYFFFYKSSSHKSLRYSAITLFPVSSQSCILLIQLLAIHARLIWLHYCCLARCLLDPPGHVPSGPAADRLLGPPLLARYTTSHNVVLYPTIYKYVILRHYIMLWTSYHVVATMLVVVIDHSVRVRFHRLLRDL